MEAGAARHGKADMFDAMIEAASTLDELRIENANLKAKVGDLERRLRAALAARGSGCMCSSVYLELSPGIHAQYCPLVGQALEDGRQRWTCERCGAVSTVEDCIVCEALELVP